MRQIKYLVIFLLAVIVLISCGKIEQLPPVPQIEFTSFVVFDTTDILGNKYKGGRLKFSFKDGDGDLGLEVPTDNQPDTTNMFFTLYRKNDGKMIPAPANDPFKPSSYRIPYMERLGQNKILKGIIAVTFLYPNYSKSDTIKYDFYIRDRALNESNMASTSELVLSVNKIYTK